MRADSGSGYSSRRVSRRTPRERTATQGGTWNVTGTINTGTIQNLNAGTLTSLVGGSVTVNSKPQMTISSYGTFGNGTIGTLVAAPGVGTSIYVTSFALDGDVSALGTPDIVLSFGTVQSGNGMIFRGGLPTTSPVQQAFAYPVSGSVTNTPLTFMQLSGGGTMSWNISYFIQ